LQFFGGKAFLFSLGIIKIKIWDSEDRHFSSAANEAKSGARDLEQCLPSHPNFMNLSTSHQVVLIFIYNACQDPIRILFSNKTEKDPLIVAFRGGENSFKVRRLHKDFLAQVWGCGKQQTSFSLPSGSGS
jgi:hypothetical protein